MDKSRVDARGSEEDTMRDSVIVMSTDASLAGLIARTLRCRQIYCALLAEGSSADELAAFEPRGYIFAANDEPPEALVDLALSMGDKPVLALGTLAPALCRRLGGEAGEPAARQGAITLSLFDSPLFTEISGGERVLHDISELLLPPELAPLATATERVIGFNRGSLYALQYPIERNDPDAAQLLYNFAADICKCSAEWDEDAITNESVEIVRECAGGDNVLCAVSGGVDSAVCAKLAKMAVGDRLMCVFVDTGLFRSDEPQNVINAYMDSMGIVVAYVDAKETFLRALSGVGSTADKERIASSLMTQVLLKQLSYDPAIKTIIMGTNFNDTLYGFSPSEQLGLDGTEARVCEPVRYLFKDEVRRLAHALELPAAIADRQPFPASGLALRVICDVTEERLQILRQADEVFLGELTSAGLDRRLWQAYATLMINPEQPGTYAVCLRALQAGQGFAYAARLPADVLERVTAAIMKRAESVTRVVYDLTPSKHYVELE